MFPFIAIAAAAAAAAAAGKLIYDAVTEDSSAPSLPRSYGSTEDGRQKERETRLAFERAWLTRQACDEAASEMRILLETHREVVCGNAKHTVLLDDLRKVDAMTPRTAGVTALEPLAVGLNHTKAYKAETRSIEQLKAEQAALQKLIRSL
jgi:hypothetical protein